MSWGEISGKGVGSSYLRVSPGGSEGPAQASPPFIPLGKVDVMTSGALPPHPAPPPPAGERRWPRVSRGAETLAQRPLPRPLSLGKLHPGWGQRLSDRPRAQAWFQAVSASRHLSVYGLPGSSGGEKPLLCVRGADVSRSAEQGGARASQCAVLLAARRVRTAPLRGARGGRGVGAGRGLTSTAGAQSPSWTADSAPGVGVGTLGKAALVGLLCDGGGGGAGRRENARFLPSAPLPDAPPHHPRISFILHPYNLSRTLPHLSLF